MGAEGDPPVDQLLQRPPFVSDPAVIGYFAAENREPAGNLPLGR